MCSNAQVASQIVHPRQNILDRNEISWQASLPVHAGCRSLRYLIERD